MFDTVVFELKDLKEHEDLAKGLLRETKYTQNKFQRVAEEYQIERMPMFRIMEFMRFGDTMKEIPLGLRGKLKVPSSHYFVAYEVKHDQDKIVFNVSIPKYLYGTNVCQFITHNTSRHFNFNSYLMSEQVENMHRNLKYFFEIFFFEQFLDQPINLKKLVIKRVDICFNQYFRTKQDALDYLELQKRINFKSERKDSASISRYKTGVFYKTKRSVFKIYHKGSEYSKSDKKAHIRYNEGLIKKQKHIKENKELSASERFTETQHLKTRMIDIEFLQNEADLILRYEVSFRANYISYIFKRKVFRNTKKSEFNKIRAEYAELERKSKHGKKLIELNQEEKKRVKTLNQIFDKVHEFYLFPPTSLKLHQRIDLDTDYNLKEAYFSKKLLKYLFKEFKARCDIFQVKAMPPASVALLKVAEYNEKRRIKKNIYKGVRDIVSKKDKKVYGFSEVNESRLAGLLALLQKYTIDELKEMGIFKRSTFYRYKKELREICGIDINAVNSDISAPINCNMDFTDYLYRTFRDHRYFVRGTKFLLDF